MEGPTYGRRCEEALDRGPGPVTAADLELMRYGLTDLLDDLADARSEAETTASATAVWRATAELALAVGQAWNGTGKWLVRELRTLDEREGTHTTADLDSGLRRALAGDRGELIAVADSVLDRCGGRFRAGLRLDGELPGSP